MTEILLLADTFPPNRGGSEAYLAVVVQGLAERGYMIHVITPETASHNPRPKFHPNVTIRRSELWLRLQQFGGHKNRFVNRISRLLIIPMLVLKTFLLRPDVFIAGHIVPAGVIGNFLKALRRCKCVLVVTYGEDITMYKHGDRMKRLVVKALSAADAVTCLTSSSKEELEVILPGTVEKTEVVPPSVESRNEFHAVDLEASGFPILFTISRIVERKGIDTTIKAVALLREQFPEIRYYIAGLGPDLDRLKRLVADLDLKDHVEFLGSVEHPGYLFQMCDVFCMPNRMLASGEREGFGIVFLEAGLYGKPSIAGRSGGAIDAVVDHETGLLVDPEDPAATAKAVNYLLSKPERLEHMGRAAKAFAEQFTHSRLAGAFDALIRKCLFP